MFGALLIRLNMDGESLQDRGYFDVILVGVNLTPLLLPLTARHREEVQERPGS